MPKRNCLTEKTGGLSTMMAGVAGFEPATYALTVRRATATLYPSNTYTPHVGKV